jgi:methyltransferase FkbM-like protein
MLRCPQADGPGEVGVNLMTRGAARGSSRLGSRLKAIAMAALPLSAWRRLLRLPPVRALRDALVGPSDTGHLAEGPVKFERLQFQFAAPYHTWIKARQRGIENRICRLFLSQCQDGFVGIDVGANCGFISMVIALAVGPTGKVLSFEADSSYFDVLRRNVRLNGLDGVCEPFHAFVGQTSSGDGRVSVDDVVRRRGLTRVDAMKVDVDGPDLEVLRGAKETLQRFRPLVVVEMSEKQDAIYRFLKDEVGYTTLVDQSGEGVVPGQWPLNLIASDGAIVIPKRGELS